MAGACHDQIAWVVARLRDDPESRSATITTFQPLTDTSYIPCVSMLDEPEWAAMAEIAGAGVTGS